MIRVLGLALYGPMAASHRVRLGQYVPGLARAGVRLRIQSLMTDRYLRYRFGGGSLPLRDMLGAGVRRLADLAGSADHDLAIVYGELFPLVPGRAETLLLRRPYIYDFDDAFYLKYRTGRLAHLGPVLGCKFDRVIERAAAVTAGNEILAAYARRLNPQTLVLPTVVDTERYCAGRRRMDDVFTVGWIGSPSTGPYLAELVAPLARVGSLGRLRLVVCGAAAPRIPNVETIEVPWSEATEVAVIQGFDVGVMPLPDDDWSRGKCAYKLVQYMACGVPVVASAIGANVDVVTPECGYLVRGADEWVATLQHLRHHAELRSSMGAAGAARVAARYSLKATLPVLTDLIGRIAAQSA